MLAKYKTFLAELKAYCPISSSLHPLGFTHPLTPWRRVLL